MHQGEGERRVGPRSYAEPLVRDPRRSIAVGVDDDHAGAFFTGLIEEGHEVHLGGDHVCPPDDDEIAVHRVLGIHPVAAADRDPVTLVGPVAADILAQPRGAQPVEEGVGAVAVHEAHGAGVGVLQERFAAAFPAGDVDALGDDGDRLLPADAFKAALALGPASAKGVEHTLARVDDLFVGVDLAAEKTPGHGVLGVSTELNGPGAARVPAIILNGDQDAAGIRAVV